MRLGVFFRTRLDKGACLSKASCRSWRLVMSECVLSCFPNASCLGGVPFESVLRSWRLVKCECVLSCFSERVLTRERAYRKRLVGLGVLFSVNASCCVFRTRLDKGACHLKASCRSWRLVMSDCVLSCFPNTS